MKDDSTRIRFSAETPRAGLLPGTREALQPESRAARIHPFPLPLGCAVRGRVRIPGPGTCTGNPCRGDFRVRYLPRHSEFAQGSLSSRLG